MIRELILKINSSLSERRSAPRRRHVAPIKVWFDADTNTVAAQEAARTACILGETMDISRSGIAFLVPSIRWKEKYLVGHQRKLNVEIDIPQGKIYMKVIGVRYEKVGLHISTERFLVGAHILEITGLDKDNYEALLRTGKNEPLGVAASLELGID